jgi:hypothetical protein
MVSAFPLLLVLAMAGTQQPAAPSVNNGNEASKTVRQVLSSRSDPWYDPSSDKLKPVLTWPDFGSWSFFGISDFFSRIGKAIANWLRGMNRWRIPNVAGAGDLIVIGVAMIFLTLLLVLLLELLRRYRPIRDDAALGGSSLRTGSAERIEGLPAGVPDAMADPWAEALRRRARGDYAGAVIYLFAYQLLTLHRLGQVRIVPGRTGRQLVRSVSDREVRGLVEPTLRLFERVYYGEQSPTLEVFEPVWSSAERFQAQFSEGSPA